MNDKEALLIKTAEKTWRLLRPVCIFFVSLCLVSGLLFSAYTFVYNRYVRPVDPSELTENDDSFVVVQIKSGSTVSAIARQLQEAGIIRNKGVFQYTAEFLSKGPKLQAGTFLLSPKMTIFEIIDTLSSMQEAKKTMKFTLVEGTSVEEMAKSLVKQGVLENGGRFLELCKSGESFAQDYDFVRSAMEEAGPDRKYVLEGYLFPDTYEIYVGASEETIIRKMLSRMNEMLSLANAHAEEGAMSIDEIVTLASLIEKEAKRSDFAKVSAVFRNRLEADMKLQSDVTVQYITGATHIVLTSEELNTESDYNTYLINGLPEGPICCPSQFALEAALYPDETFVEDKVLYFCAADPTSGELVFAKNLEDHRANVAKYQDLWLAFDQDNAAKEQE